MVKYENERFNNEQGEFWPWKAEIMPWITPKNAGLVKTLSSGTPMPVPESIFSWKFKLTREFVVL